MSLYLKSRRRSAPPVVAAPRAPYVGRAVDAALASGGSSAELERVVRAYVRALKNTDMPPEQAVKRVKNVVGSPRVTLIADLGAQPPHQLAGNVVAWFVAEYYRAD